MWFPDQGLNLGPLHWEQSLSHQTTREVPDTTLRTVVIMLYIRSLDLISQTFKRHFSIHFTPPPPTPPTSSSSPILLWGELGEWRGWVEAGLFVFLLSQEVVEMSQG